MSVHPCVFTIVDISTSEQLVDLAMRHDHLSQCLRLLHRRAHHFDVLHAASVIRKADDVWCHALQIGKLFAKLPIRFRGMRPEFVMSAGTYESVIKSLADDNDRPVYYETFNPADGAETATFKGREVVFVEEDIFKTFGDIDLTGTDSPYFGMLWVPSEAYAINSNMEFFVKRYFDEEKNEYVDKALVINDGKVLDGECIYLLPDSPLHPNAEIPYGVQLRGGVVSVAFSANMGVIKTRSGYARGIAGDIDRCNFESVLGTVAGDDTILLVIKEGYTKDDVLLQLERIVPEIKTLIKL